MKNRGIRRIFCLLLALTVCVSLASFEMGTVKASGEGIQNPEYTFTSVEEERVSTNSQGRITVIVFGKTNCGNTQATVRNFAGSSWIKRSDVRVIFAECSQASSAAVKNFAAAYGCSSMIYCYDEYGFQIWPAAGEYHDLFYEPHLNAALPFTAVIDNTNQVRKVFSGAVTANALQGELDKIGSSGGDETPDPVSPAASVKNVSGLHAAPETSSVKLTWKKVSGAQGYFIYQYSGKKWKKIATVKTNKPSYKVTKRKAATGYRFAVKAYKTQNGKTIASKSYTSLYTATKPTAIKVRVTAGKKKATLKWNRVKGASGYTVYYKTSAKGAWKKLKDVKGASYIRKNLQTGKTYYFMVKAYKTYKGQRYTGTGTTEKGKVK